MCNLAIKVWSCAFTKAGIFIVSSIGDVYFIRYGRSPKTHFDKDGYVTFTCRTGLYCNRFLIHRLVAIAFIPNPENKPQVNHIDSNRANNNLYNLEWNTSKEDCFHKFNVGGYVVNRGWAHKLSKPVTQYDKDLNKIADYGGASEASRVTGICQATITHCCNLDIYSAGGFFWAYIGESTDRFIGRKPRKHKTLL
jgi:hypothetical protein